jgi:hypothetical protein
MNIAPEMVRAIALMCDPVGVVSLYVDADPAMGAGGQRTWDEQARLGLSRLPQDAGADAPLVRERLSQLAPVIDSLLDPTVPGRGRVLFAALRRDEAYAVDIQPDVPADLRLQPRAHLVPLLATLGRERAVGAAVLSLAELRILELELAETSELSRRDVSPRGFEWSLLKEPNAGVVEDVRRISDRAADEVSRVAGARGWSAVVVAGNQRLVDRLAVTLEEAGLLVETCTVDPPAEAPPSRIGEMLQASAADVRRRQTAQLISHISADGGPHGRGTFDVGAVLQALSEGRVEHLVLDSDAELRGAVTDDGRLTPASDLAAGDVRDLADEMVERAFGTDARVTVVSRSVDDLSVGSGGVAALLRW